MMLVCVRIHNCYGSSFPSIESVLKFIERASAYSNDVLICLGSKTITELSNQVTIYQESFANLESTVKVTLLPVFPWGYFTTALNVAVLFAQDNRFSLLAFQSLEYQTTSKVINALKTILLDDENALMCGPEINGHEFNEGFTELRGRTCPWNTCAIWKVDKLGLIGYPLIGDGTGENRSIGGVEEVTAITLLQYLNPTTYSILVRFADDVEQTQWHTTFDETERKQYHEKKMKSKDERPDAQLKCLHTQPTTVLHVVHKIVNSEA